LFTGWPFSNFVKGTEDTRPAGTHQRRVAASLRIKDKTRGGGEVLPQNRKRRNQRREKKKSEQKKQK
jgi:hypothetical protein